MCVAHQSWNEWFGVFFLFIVVSSLSDSCSRSLAYTRLFEGNVRAFFYDEPNNIQYTPIYAVTIMRFYNHPAIFEPESTRSLSCSFSRSISFALPFAVSFCYTSRHLYASLPHFTAVSFNHTQSLYTLLSHMQPEIRYTICPIFNSSEVTRFSLLSMAFKKGSSNNEKWREWKNISIRVPFTPFVKQIFKKLPLFFRNQ